jgi:6-phosphofructokinase 2
MAVVLDTSGAALRAALAGGGIRLVKPSLSELEQLNGQPLSDEAAIITAARAIVERGGAELVAVSRGGQGAVLVGDGPALVQPAIHVEAKSAVGAGDSFVAAMTFALARGWPPAHALGLGIAAGAAAALTPGTDLCHRADVERLAATLGITGLG